MTHCTHSGNADSAELTFLSVSIYSFVSSLYISVCVT